MAGRIKVITVEIGGDTTGLDKALKGVNSTIITTLSSLLRCSEVGISFRDLDLLTIGVVLDMWTEKSNDGVTYRRIADQADFDKF